jgi:hypothetical protein
MSIAALKSRRSLERSGAGSALVVAGAGAPVFVEAPSELIWAPGEVRSTYCSLSAFDPQLNATISGAQQALEFLDGLAALLDELRSGLQPLLSRTPPDSAMQGAVEVAGARSVDELIQRCNEFWLTRAAATGGTLDGQLAFRPSGDSRQKFMIRGLSDIQTLRAKGPPETLYFSVGSRGHRAASCVAIDPKSSNATLVHRFDRALAPSGVRAMEHVAGTMLFSVAETAWPEIQGTLAVMGEGRRFSTGRFNPVRVVAETPVMSPEGWSSADTTGLRQTRQEVFRAQGLVRQARRLVAQALAAADPQPVGPGSAGRLDAGAERQWCREFTAIFEATADRSDYLALSALGPALTGITRQRAITVLSLT